MMLGARASQVPVTSLSKPDRKAYFERDCMAVGAVWSETSSVRGPHKREISREVPVDSAEYLAPSHVLRGESVGQQIGSSGKTGNNRDLCSSAWTEASGRSLIDHDSIKMPPTPRDCKSISWMTSATQRSLSGRPSLESALHAPWVSALAITRPSRTLPTTPAFMRI